MNVGVGLKGEARLVVGEADTASALGSGDVNVLGTPRMVALFEQATVDALRGMLEEGQSSVGMRVQIDHLQPTPIGAEVVVVAVLDKVEGRRITFAVTASDSGGLVAAGKVTRVVVDVQKFMSRLQRRLTPSVIVDRRRVRHARWWRRDRERRRPPRYHRHRGSAARPVA
ncbi:MAG: hotdog domain-containing protein [Ilumatobacteraceae bacterium]